MQNQYLQGDDLAAFGVAGATAAQINQASSLIDAALYRPEGLLWAPDATGMPCFMAGLSPTFTLTAPSAIPSGLSVEVPVVGPSKMIQTGDVLILDRANQNAVEACVVASTAPGVIVLRQVQYDHGASTRLDAGMVIEESKLMPKARPLTQVARTPVARVISGSGRYGYGRRGDAATSSMDDFNLLAALSHFGGPPLWEGIPEDGVGFDPTTGQVRVPSGIMLAYFTEVKLRYIAGWQYQNLPSVIKAACAALVQGLVANPEFGNVKSVKSGDTMVVNFTNGALDDDMKMQLSPFRAHLFC